MLKLNAQSLTVLDEWLMNNECLEQLEYYQTLNDGLPVVLVLKEEEHAA